MDAQARPEAALTSWMCHSFYLRMATLDVSSRVCSSAGKPFSPSIGQAMDYNWIVDWQGTAAK